MIISELVLLPPAGEENSLVWGMVNPLPIYYHSEVPKEAQMTGEVIKEDQVLDCSGMLCPMPVVKTTKTIKEMQSGQILKMVATDPGAPPDMEAWSRQTGNELLRSTTEDGKFVFFLKKK